MVNMSAEKIEISCRCKAVRGQLDPKAVTDGIHIACYCKDCRAYARLKGEENALEPGGGVGMLQTTIDRLEISHGTDQLACQQFGEKTPLRWYAKCCDAPIALSMPNPGVAHLSVPTTAVEDETLLGPVRSRVNLGSATAPVSESSDIGLPGLVLRMMVRLIKARLRGAAKKSALYDPNTRDSIVAPTRISDEAKATAYQD